MGNHQQENTADEAEGLPALLPILYAVMYGHAKGVSKNVNCLFEPQTVLPLVGEVLGFIPLESNLRHGTSVHAIL